MTNIWINGRYIRLQPAKDSLKSDSGAVNWEVMWPKPHLLVVKYRDNLTVLHKVLEQEFMSSSRANGDHCNKN